MHEHSGDVISFHSYCWSLSKKSFQVTLNEGDSQRLEEYLNNKNKRVSPVASHNTKCADDNSYEFQFLGLKTHTKMSGCVNKLPGSNLYEFYFRDWGNRKKEFSAFRDQINKANTTKGVLLYLPEVTLDCTKKSVSFEAAFNKPSGDSTNQSECTGGSRSRCDSVRVPDKEVEAEDKSYNPPSSEKTDAIQMKIEDLRTKIRHPEGLAKEVINNIEQAFSERRQREAQSIALQVDPIDLRLVKEILAKVTTPHIVKTTFGEDMLFKKIYELPSDRRLEFLKVRLLLNLLKLKSFGEKDLNQKVKKPTPGPAKKKTRVPKEKRGVVESKAAGSDDQGKAVGSTRTGFHNKLKPANFVVDLE